MGQVRRHIPLITVFVCQVLVIGLLLLLYFKTRPTFAAVYSDLGARTPALSALALSNWFLPALAISPFVADALAFLLPRKSQRNAAVGFGLMIPAFGLALSAFGLFVPLFQLAPVP